MVCTSFIYPCSGLKSYILHMEAKVCQKPYKFHFFSSRGEDVSEFMPAPHYILMADCIYYEQVVCYTIKSKYNHMSPFFSA